MILMRHFIFPCPDPNVLGFWARPFFTSWDVVILLVGAFVFLAMIKFYWFSLPDKKANTRFWWYSGIVIALGPVISAAFLISNRRELVKSAVASLRIYVPILWSSLLLTVEWLIIAYCLMMLLSAIPVNWQLRAMRRYPLKYIP